jgi:hypothetical protein
MDSNGFGKLLVSNRVDMIAMDNLVLLMNLKVN